MNVSDHLINVIIGNIRRFVWLVVSALVNRNHVIIFAELFQLIAPAEPELGKAVNEENQRLRRIAFLNVMNFDALLRSSFYVESVKYQNSSATHIDSHKSVLAKLVTR